VNGSVGYYIYASVISVMWALMDRYSYLLLGGSIIEVMQFV
jgi:hypothetical protein